MKKALMLALLALLWAGCDRAEDTTTTTDTTTTGTNQVTTNAPAR